MEWNGFFLFVVLYLSVIDWFFVIDIVWGFLIVISGILGFLLLIVIINIYKLVYLIYYKLVNNLFYLNIE